MQTCAAGLALSHLSSSWASAPVFSGQSGSGAVVRLETDLHRPLITALSWDTEGGDRVRTNLLRANNGVGLRIRAEDIFIDATDLPTTVQSGPGGVSYLMQISRRGALHWEVFRAPDSFKMKFAALDTGALDPGSVELVFRFDPRVTPTTVLPSVWNSDGSFLAPLIISAPDFGQMLMRVTPGEGSSARLGGSRQGHIVDLIVALPQLDADHPCTLSFTPVILDPPTGLQDTGVWRLARRGWFNAFQPAAPWGNPQRAASSPAGVLSNNVISDPCSFSLIFSADHSLFTSPLPDGISVANLVRQSIEFWINKRTRTNGEVAGYIDYYNFLDANAGPLTCAWDYVETTNDLAWLEKTIARLEFIADVNARRDQDHDGLVEASQSGNPSTLYLPDRSSNWWDAVNFGHKDAYANAVIYRSWRCLADLEAKLHRDSEQARFTQLADRLRDTYARHLLNPRTGWIAEWCSREGLLYDHASPVTNGLAVAYGLVSPDQGRGIVDKLWAKMKSVGFNRYDLGIPSCLEPIPQADYCQPNRSNPSSRPYGSPETPDGKDTFQMYQNGGISAGMGAHFLMASYRVGRAEEADRVLHAMLARQQAGLFQNGVVNQYPKGLEWATWEGKPCGYEGYLADVYFFLMAAVLREPAMQARYFRPMVTPA
ncbi:MAG: hypothetical protein ABSF45_10310 [Terriglobia bacterium]